MPCGKNFGTKNCIRTQPVCHERYRNGFRGDGISKSYGDKNNLNN